MTEIEELKKRIIELEKKVNSKNISLFGSSYSNIGSSDSDLIVKTKGKIKIQWGNKFIDLLKDGKINVDSKFIFKKDSIGSKDGIYVIKDKVYLLINGESILLTSDEIGTTYVSFMENQETNSSAKYNALTNIGFIYPTIESITEESLKNGIIYIENLKKLYIVSDGKLEEYTIEFPNSFNKQFIVSKNDSQKGAIYIKGFGIENSLAFNNLYFYSKNDQSIIDFNSKLNINNSDKELIIIEPTNAIYNIPILSNRISSINSDSDSGFKLYVLNGKSYLEVDNIKVRNSNDDIHLYPEYWFLKNNIISNSKFNEESQSELIFTLSLNNEFKIGDLLFVYYNEESNEDEEVLSSEEIKLKCEIIAISENKITVKFDLDITNEDSFINQFIFLVLSDDKYPLRLKSNTLDIVNYSNEEILTRIGDLFDLLSIKENGIYSKYAIFEDVYCNKELNLDDKSNLIPNTKWVLNKLELINNYILELIQNIQELINSIKDNI